MFIIFLTLVCCFALIETPSGDKNFAHGPMFIFESKTISNEFPFSKQKQHLHLHMSFHPFLVYVAAKWAFD